MGQAKARLFAQEGAQVVVANILETQAQQVVADLTQASGKAHVIRLDVTQKTDWQEAIRTTVSTFGKLDTLVNNAGLSGTHDTDHMSPS